MSYTMSVFFTHTPQYSKIFTKISHTHTFTPLFDIHTLKTYMPHIHMAFHNRFIWAILIGLEIRFLNYVNICPFFLSQVYICIFGCVWVRWMFSNACQVTEKHFVWMKRIYIDEVMCIASVYVFVFSVFFQIDQGREK